MGRRGGCPWSSRADGKHEKGTRGCGCPDDPDHGKGGSASVGQTGRPGGGAVPGSVIIKAHPFTAGFSAGEYVDARADTIRNWTCTVCGRSKTTRNDPKPPGERCPEVKKK